MAAPVTLKLTVPAAPPVRWTTYPVTAGLPVQVRVTVSGHAVETTAVPITGVGDVSPSVTTFESGPPRVSHWLAALILYAYVVPEASPRSVKDVVPATTTAPIWLNAAPLSDRNTRYDVAPVTGGQDRFAWVPVNEPASTGAARATAGETAETVAGGVWLPNALLAVSW